MIEKWFNHCGCNTFSGKSSPPPFFFIFYFFSFHTLLSISVVFLYCYEYLLFFDKHPWHFSYKSRQKILHVICGFLSRKVNKVDIILAFIGPVIHTIKIIIWCNVCHFSTIWLLKKKKKKKMVTVHLLEGVFIREKSVIPLSIQSI